jgi:hypothetical protein
MSDDTIGFRKFRSERYHCNGERKLALSSLWLGIVVDPVRLLGRFRFSSEAPNVMTGYDACQSTERPSQRIACRGTQYLPPDTHTTSPRFV